MGFNSGLKGLTDKPNTHNIKNKQEEE